MTLTMVTAVFLFAFLGFAFLGPQHSVANTVFFLILGLSQGVDVAAAAGDVAIALVGSFIGGGILIGVYYAYVNNPSRVAPRDVAAQGRRRAIPTSQPPEPAPEPSGNAQQAGPTILSCAWSDGSLIQRGGSPRCIWPRSWSGLRC